jgi:hypothetical protein
MAATLAVMVHQSEPSTFLAYARALLAPLVVANFAEPSLASCAVLLEETFDADSSLFAGHAEAKTLKN